MVKNLRTIVFFVFLCAYAFGVCIGSVRQVKTERQTEMYEYLSGAVSGYKSSPASGIKRVAEDNAVLLGVLAISGVFKPMMALGVGTVAVKGYATGFSITAMLRLYGMKGLIMCTANLLSAMVVVPAIAYYGAMSAENLARNKSEKNFYKYFIFLILFLTAIFCIDSIARGFFSSIFMKFAPGAAKSA